MPRQNYEKYWNITNAFTNYNGEKFLKTLRICIDFIDENKDEKYSQDKYEKLQIVANFDGINPISVRKRINQFVKLGFIAPFLASYPYDSLKYIDAKTDVQRGSILSKIVYKHSKLNASVNEDSSLHQINFLLKTLEEVGKLHQNDLIGLMLVDISNIEKGYLSVDELEAVRRSASNINFKERKYNQISHFWNLLKKLDDLAIIDATLYFEDDAKLIIVEKPKPKSTKRDAYLHRIYKYQLKEESREYFKSDVKCMLEELAYPSLVASHIKPFIDSNDFEAYDSNNGLLLSRNMDILFDQGDITFKKSGNIVCSSRLNDDLVKHLKNYTLPRVFLSECRLKYLKYHRKNIFKKVS